MRYLFNVSLANIISPTKFLLLISCLPIGFQAQALTFNLPSTDSDGTFTFTWSGAGTYVNLFEQENGSFTSSAMWGQSTDSGSYTLTRSAGIHTFKLMGCSVTGGQYGPITTCSEIIKSITIGGGSIPPAPSGNVVFVHTDIQGTPVAETDVEGNKK